MAKTSLRILFEGKHPILGHIDPLQCAARSPAGLWFGGAHLGNTVLFSPDGLSFESREAPTIGHLWLSILCLSKTRFLAAGYYGLRASDNGGKNWEGNVGRIVAEMYDLLEARDGKIWACGENVVASSTNGGKTWKQTALKAQYLMCLHECADGRILVGGDGGIRVVKGAGFRVVEKTSSRVRRFARSPNGVVVAVGEEGLLLRSTDDGKSWKRIKALDDHDLYGVGWTSQFVAVGENASLLTSPDGVTWKRTSLGRGLTGEAVLPFMDGAFITAERDKENHGALLWMGPPRKAVARAPTKAAPVAIPPAPKRPKKPTTKLVPKPEKLSWDAAIEEFPDLDGNTQDHPEDRVVSIYRGNLCTRTLKLSAVGENKVVIVDGDLWCDGPLVLRADQDDDAALALYVTGNVSASNVDVAGDPTLIVEGDLVVDEVAMVGGGNLGNFEIAGSLRCRVVVQFAWGQIHIGGKLDGLALAHTASHIDKPSKGSEKTGPDVFLETMLDGDGAPDQEKLQQAIATKKRVLRPPTTGGS